MHALATLLDLRYKGRLLAPDELEAIKQWAITKRDSSRQICPPTPQPPPPNKARTGPLDMLDAILGAPCSAHLIHISCVTGGC